MQLKGLKTCRNHVRQVWFVMNAYESRWSMFFFLSKDKSIASLVSVLYVQLLRLRGRRRES